jgi:micrococcal nuclease
MNLELYNYKAFVTSVYDGDTITCDIDCGFGVILKKQKIRLYGINTPEIRGESKELGIISRDKLREQILDKYIILKTIKDKKGKYGRYLGIIYINNININEWLIENGYAIKY